VVPEKRINLSLPDVAEKRNIRGALFGELQSCKNRRKGLLAKQLDEKLFKLETRGAAILDLRATNHRIGVNATALPSWPPSQLPYTS
jgi:hypothetical protein